MKNPVESLLGDDHESLGQLLTELDGELAKHNFPRAFELLDLFWARLAIHIRAENLHLFPALANARASLFTGKGGLPTRDEAHNVLLQLRITEWRSLLESQGFEVQSVETAPMSLLEPGRLIRDEGLLGTLRFIWNLLRDSEARQRVLEMRAVFRRNRNQLGAVAVICFKR